MEWNLNDLLKIKADLLRISELDDLSVKDKYKYANDMYIIDMMINYLQGNKKTSYYNNDITSIIDPNFYKGIIDWINKYGASVYLNLRPYSDEKVKTKFIYRRNCLFEEDSIEVLKQFFKEYNPKLIPFLDDLLENKKIHFSDKKSPLFNNNGCLLNLMSSGNSFIFQNDSLRLSDMQVLAKNIQSAYDFSKKEDELKQNTNLSPLAYAKGKFAQLAFIDFLKSTKYAEEASVLEGKQLNEFFKLIDDGVGQFVLPSSALIVDNKLMDKKYNNYIKYILSTLQAYAWLNDYRENPDLLKEKLKEFDSNFGKSELENIKVPEIINMEESLSKIEDSYVRTRTLYR